jgi:hypothetical protein
MRLVDSGSGYDAHNDLPVQFGIPSSVRSVVVEVTSARGVRRSKPIDPRAWRGKVFAM